MAAGFLGKSIWILALAAALVIFLQPDVVDGLKCFHCEGIDCHKDKGQEAEDCNDVIKFCYKNTVTSGGKPEAENRRCADEDEDKNGKVEEGCTESKDKTPTGHELEFKKCYCSTNGCNSSGNLRGWSIQIQILTVSALLFVVASVTRVGVAQKYFAKMTAIVF